MSFEVNRLQMSRQASGDRGWKPHQQLVGGTIRSAALRVSTSGAGRTTALVKWLRHGIPTW